MVALGVPEVPSVDEVGQVREVQGHLSREEEEPGEREVNFYTTPTHSDDRPTDRPQLSSVGKEEASVVSKSLSLFQQGSPCQEGARAIKK